MRTNSPDSATVIVETVFILAKQKASFRKQKDFFRLGRQKLTL
jgi:hypothetical protein